MNRTFRGLYVLHHEKEPARPLADVPGISAWLRKKDDFDRGQDKPHFPSLTSS